MNSPLSRYLRDFAAESAPVATMPLDVSLPLHLPSEMPALDMFEAHVDLEAERQQAHDLAYDEGRQAAEAAMAAKHAEELAALQEKHAAEMETQRQQFEGGVADYLAKALPELADRVAAELADSAARLFLPMLRNQAERSTVEDLATQLKQALSKEIVEQIRVTGPAHLCDLLRDQLQERGDAIEFTPSDSGDVRVEIGDSLLVTRLSAFSAELEKVLA